jgi:amino acid adenylation domain-containing protein
MKSHVQAASLAVGAPVSNMHCFDSNLPFRPARPAKGDAKRVPLTAAQREIWFASQLAPAVSQAYHESFTLRLTGTLHREALHEAARQLVARHEALRATFTETGDAQLIAAELEVTVGWRDLSLTESDARETAAADCIALHLDHPFDLVNGPLFRVLLLRLDAQTHLVVFIVHHIVCDGWSLGILQRELGELYSASVAGRVPGLATPSSFAEHAASEAALHATPPFLADEAYWKQQFAGDVPVLELPTDRARPTTRTYEGRCLMRTLPADATAALKRLCGEKQVTPFTLMLAAFTVLLHRLTDQDDVVVGVPSATQVMAGFGGLVGHFANLLPLRSRFQAEQPFSDYLVRVRQSLSDAMEHWRHPFVHLVQSLNLPRDANRVPLAPVVFNATSRTAGPKFAGLIVDVEGNPKRFVNFDLNFNFVVGRETVLMGAHYSTELFDRQTIERWFGHFETLLRGIAENPEESVGNLPLLTEAERAQILGAWNHTALAYRRDACVHELFEEQARSKPDAIALVAGRERISYADLNRRADRLAAQLRSVGVAPETLVGLFLERTSNLVVGMLGVLKAGGAYVPLDRASPTERLAFVIDDTRMPVIVTQRSLLRHLPPTNVRLLVIDDESLARTGAGTQSAEQNSTQAARVTAENLAYVIYTSGSTGQPKGVALMHRGVVALAAWAGKFYRADELDGVLCATSAAFDVSVFESLVILALGGKVILAEDIFHLPSLPAVDEVRLISGVPSAIAELVRIGKMPLRVRTVNLAGEPCPQALVETLYALPNIERVIDVYGPTETTVYSTGGVRKRGGHATIGRPLANERVYILDSRRRVVPIGVRGELYIGGDKLARGYLNQPALTAERFVLDPFVGPSLAAGPSRGAHTNRHGLPTSGSPTDVVQARLYRTGDAARFLPDGTIEFLGRLDHQVKLRGYRIELGEIESVLAQCPGIAEAVVVARTESTGQRLVAYVVGAAGATVNVAELREQLFKRLPDYMVPAAFVALEHLPRTSSGKIDRRALPEPERGPSVAAHVAPRNATEEFIADLWCKVLGLGQVGVHDNFFELGGHSLLATQLIARLHDALGVELTMRQFFVAPTVATLAAAVEAALIEDMAACSSQTSPDPNGGPAS